MYHFALHDFANPLHRLGHNQQGNRMPNYLAIEWGKQQVIGLDAQVSGTGVAVHRSFVLAWPDDIDPVEQPQPAGEWLKAQLDRLGVKGKQVLVALPREDVVVRRLELPQASDEMLPGIVRYQAGAKSTLPLDQMLLDYVPVPRQPTAEGRAVLIVTVAKQLVDQLQSVMQSAGLELVAVEITPAATLELIARAEQRRGHEPSETSLVVACSGPRVEISLIQDHHLVFSHAARFTSDDEPQHRNLLGAINRALVAMEPSLTSAVVARVWLMGIGDGQSKLVESLKSRLGCDVHTLDSVEDLPITSKADDIGGNAALFVAPLGMLLARSGAVVRERIDFLHPRQAIARRNWRSMQLVTIAAAVLLMTAAGSVGVWLQLQSLDEQITRKQLEDQQLELLLKQGQPTLQSAEALGEWQKRNVNWLPQMQAVIGAMPDADRMYLQNWRFTSGQGDAAAGVQADGFARERADVERLNQQLADQQGFRVQPNEIQSQSFGEYPFHFELDADVVPRRSVQGPARSAAMTKQ